MARLNIADENVDITSQTPGPRRRTATTQNPELEPADNDEEDIDYPTAGTTPTRRRRMNTEMSRTHPTSFRRRILYIAFFLLALWLTYTVRAHLARKASQPPIIYASRYSKEHKFRPAASPIITETLKDGRIRLRGATPPPEPVPTPTPTPTRKRRPGRRRKSKSTRKTAA